MPKEENKILIISGEVRDRLGKVEGKLDEGFNDIKSRLTKVESAVEILPVMKKQLENHLKHHQARSE